MLHIQEKGSGRPILFVHGWPINGNAWHPQMTALGDQHHVLAVDLPGFGESPPLEAPTIDLLAQRLRDTLDRLELDDVFALGWSMGGTVLMSYIQQFGEHRLRALGIIDVSPCLWPRDGWALGEGTPFSREAIAEWSKTWATDPRAVAHHVYTIGFVDPEGAHAADRKRLVDESMKADRDTAMVALLDGFNQDYRPVLPTITLPTLLLYGRHSTSTTAYVRNFMNSTIPTSQLEVFDNSGHCLSIEEPGRFNTVVDAFAKAH